MREVVREMLASAVVRPSGIRVPSPKWRYLSLCYHYVFHGKSRHVSPGATTLTPFTFAKSRYYHDLTRLAAEAGFPRPASFDDLDCALRENDAMPGKDLIGFYARRNPFVAARYVNGRGSKPGLVVFYVRDCSVTQDQISCIEKKLATEFVILAHGPVTDANRHRILERVRGGNWLNSEGGGVSGPLYWFICWDKNPVRPTGRLSRKHPSLDNARAALVKSEIRRVCKGSIDDSRILHASDNTDETVEHIEVIGLKLQGELLEVIDMLRKG
jgi:hypothetical protein